MTTASEPEGTLSLRAKLKRDAEEGRLGDLDLGKLDEALAHPKASKVIAELLKLDAASVAAGEMAPDFNLPFLAQPDGERVALSAQRGQRPVALVFGSYT